MPIVQITGGKSIDYGKLKDYHFTAQIKYNHLIEKSLRLIEDYEFVISVDALDEDSGIEIYADYCSYLIRLNVIDEIGHLIYITQHIQNHEGNYQDEDINLDRQLIADLDILIRLIGLRDDTKSIELEFTHKAYGKDFENYIKLKNVSLNEKILETAIRDHYKYISENALIHHVHLVDRINSLEFKDRQEVINFKENIPSISDRTFKTHLLFTICDTLRRFLSLETDINPNVVTMTNDMARIIYATCKINGLIPIEHEIERDEIDYIRAILRNNRNNVPVNISVDN